MKTNSARTIRATRPAVMVTSTPSIAHERRGAPDLEHLYTGARLKGLVVVVRARRPDLAVQPDAADALGVGDPLHHGGVTADQRGRAGLDLAAGALVLARDGAQRGQRDHGHHEEHRPFDDR